jgi:hypothetical protein
VRSSSSTSRVSEQELPVSNAYWHTLLQAFGGRQFAPHDRLVKPSTPLLPETTCIGGAKALACPEHGMLSPTGEKGNVVEVSGACDVGAWESPSLLGHPPGTIPSMTTMFPARLSPCAPDFVRSKEAQCVRQTDPHTRPFLRLAETQIPTFRVAGHPRPLELVPPHRC